MNGHFLVIDDEGCMHATFKNFLSDVGHTISTATCYEDALDQAQEYCFDAIFANIILHSKDHVEFLKALNKQFFACPIIMVLNSLNLETISETVRMGAYDYLTKPILKHNLLRIAGSALRFKRMQDENRSFRAQIEGVFNSVKDALITVDDEGLITSGNKAAERICNFSRDKVGQHFADLQPFQKTDLPQAVRETLHDHKNRELFRHEFRVGHRIPKILTSTVSPLILKGDHISGAVIVIRDETRLHAWDSHLSDRQKFHTMVGKSSLMQAIYSLVEDMADASLTALILGESGTGKELVADALHHAGSHCGGPLVKVSCAALSDSLLESELFGHVRGAFTGAITSRSGRFQKADGGTIFLDEIGDISPRMQLRLLRVLQEKQFERVGESTPIKVDVRIIAATNQDLKSKVQEATFREDLYYRLNVVTFTLPTLRDRREDIPLLVEHFCQQLKTESGKSIEGISDDVMALFMAYKWPGNIRELQHVLEYAFVRCHQNVISLENLPPEIKDNMSANIILNKKNPDTEQKNIREVLLKTDWNKAKAARLLDMDRKTLYRKITQYGIVEKRP